MWSKKLWVFGLLCLMSFSHAMHGSQMEMESKSKREVDEKSKQECQAAIARKEAESFATKEDKEHKEEFEKKIKKEKEIKESVSDEETEERYGKLEAYTEKLDKSLCAAMIDRVNCSPRITEIINMWKKKGNEEYLPKRILLVGPSGTGKTTIGKAIATECDMPCYMYNASSIATSYKNSGTHNLKKIFTHAESHKPCIVILDEIEVLLKQHKNIHDTESGMLTKLWSLLDHHKKDPILFIATANSASKAPAAIETRFSGNKIETSLPNLEQRTKILEHHMKHKSSNPSPSLFPEEITAAKLASKTNNFSHRHLEHLIEHILQRTISSDKRITITMEICDEEIAKIIKSDANLNGEKEWKKWKLRGIKGISATLAIGIPLGVGYWMHKDSKKHQEEMRQKSIQEQETIRQLNLADQKQLQKDALAAQEKMGIQNVLLGAGIQIGWEILKGSLKPTPCP